MKKLMAVFLVLGLAVSSVACNKQDNNASDLQQIYVYRESDDIFKPSIVLLEDNRFQFAFSAISSYLAVGTYTINDDILVLNTDDGKYKCSFRVEGENMDRLIFDAENSSGIIRYGNFEDGAVFEQ